jgi:hypothetical protein
MAASPTVQADGSKTATVGTTPDKLADVAGPGVFQLEVDCNAMAAGDVLYISVKKMVRTGGTARYGYDTGPIFGPRPAKDIVMFSVPVSTPLSDATAIVFEINQTAGTGRAYPWSITKF